MRTKAIYYNDYSGGLNDTTHQREIKRNEASLLRNWDITYKGQLKRRDGLTSKGSFSGKTIYGLHSFMRTTGAEDLLAMADDYLYYNSSGTTWTALDTGFSSGIDFSFATVSYNDRVYMCNEDNQLHYWDRVSTTQNACLTDLGAAVPHGNVTLWHKNHLFHANNVTYSGATYENELYWSAFGDPSTYDTTTDKISLPGGGRLITIADWGDALVIFKEHSIMFLTGWGDADWSVTASASGLTNIDEAVGTISPKGVTRVGNEIWFIDDEAQIRRLYKTQLDTFRRDIVSTKIQTTISGINKAYLHLATAWTFNDKVFFSVPNGSDTRNSLVLVYDLIASKRTGEEAWTTYTGWNIDFATTYPTSTTPDLYLASKYTTYVYRFYGDDDNGTAIDARWDGKEDDFGNPDTYKRFKWGRITGSADSADVDVTFHSSVDDADFANLGNLNLQTSGGTLGPTGTFELGPTGTTAILSSAGSGDLDFYYSSGGGSVTGRTLMHSVRHAVASEQPSVNGYTSHIGERNI